MSLKLPQPGLLFCHWSEGEAVQASVALAVKVAWLPSHTLWPEGPARRIRDSLLRPGRAEPILLGSPVWSSRRGTLILAPPLISGGENGDHLIFRWSRGGVDHMVSMHSWAPLREAVATLRAVVRSAP